MKLRISTMVLSIAILMLIGSLPVDLHAQGAAQEIVPDANTVLLDHLNGSTLGTVFGSLSYATSLTGLGQAGQFGSGIFVKYAFPAWHSMCCGSALSTQGTVEMWVKPGQITNFFIGLLNFNWYNTTSFPSAGHVLHFGIEGRIGNELSYGTWNFERCCLPSGLSGTSAIPAGQWTHLAVSWSPTISKVYVNGVVEALANSNVYPAIASTVHAYLNYWGSNRPQQRPFVGLIDELHISKVQRTDAAIAQHAALTPTVLPFSAFTADIEIELGPGANDDEFELKGSFTLGGGSDGVDPLTEDVTVEVGNFSTTITAGSFKFKPAKPGKKGKPGKPAQYKFEGVIAGVNLEMKIIVLGGDVFDFKAEGEQADLTGTVNPVGVTLTIGDDTGTTSVTAEISSGDDLDKTIADAAVDGSLPKGYVLSQNHSNPFNPETEIRFELPEANRVVVRIFNTLGQEIRTLTDSRYNAGQHSVRWDAKDEIGNPVSSGVYLYQLQAGDFSQVRKMSLIR